MANETVENEEKADDAPTPVDVTVDSEGPPSSVSHYDDPEDEIRKQEEPDEKRAEREELKRSQSYATDASGLTRTTTRQSALPSQKPWYKTPNPLRWGPIPPVPKERQVSREYEAGFFSRLTFQWMAPLMSVGKPCLYQYSSMPYPLIQTRSGTSGHSRWPISGV